MEFKWNTSNLYVLPKIHKSKPIIDQITSSHNDYAEMTPPQGLKGRPIIAGPVAPTQRLSEILDTLLKPIITTLKTYVNNFCFDNDMHKQVKGTAMGKKFAPAYACLTVGYLAETKLFTVILPNYFNAHIAATLRTIFVTWATV